MGLWETVAEVGGDLLSGYLNNQAAGNAADAIADSNREGQAVSQAAINQGRQDIVSTGVPGLEDLMAGFQGAISTLEKRGPAETRAFALSGAEGPEAEQQAINEFMESPGQKFLREEGERALLRNSAAVGGLGGGRVREALVKYGIGTAAQNKQQRLNNMMGLINPETTRSTNVANILSSGGGQLANFRAGLGSNLARLAVGGSAEQIPLITGTGTANAAGILGQNQALQQTIGNTAETLGSL